MTAELRTLTIVALFTGLLWVPYILNLVMVRGFSAEAGGGCAQSRAPATRRPAPRRSSR